MSKKNSYQKIDLNIVENMLKSYSYEQTSMLEAKNIRYNPLIRTITIDNFYHQDNTRKDGTCFELTNTAYNEFSKIFPNIYFYRIAGQEPQFFNGEGSEHISLIASAIKLIPEKEKYSTIEGSDVQKMNAKEIIDEIIKTNPILIDPSYKIIKPFQETKYTIEEIDTPREHESLERTIELKEYEDLFPLTMKANKYLSLITFNEKANKHLSVEMWDYDSNVLVNKDICDSYWESIKTTDKKLYRIIKHLQKIDFIKKILPSIKEIYQRTGITFK